MFGKITLLLTGKSSFVETMATIIGCIIGFFAPIQTLVQMVFEFIAIDFIVGVWASRVKAKRAGKLSEWGFESKKAWRTIWKLLFVIIGIVLFYHLDCVILSFVELRMPQLFCGFVCSVELWSFLENAACISTHPVFKWLKKYMGEKGADYVISPDELSKAKEEDAK